MLPDRSILNITTYIINIVMYTCHSAMYTALNNLENIFTSIINFDT